MFNLAKTKGALLQQVNIVGEYLSGVSCAYGLKKALVGQLEAIESLIIYMRIDDYRKTKKELADTAEKIGGVSLYCRVMESKCKIPI